MTLDKFKRAAGISTALAERWYPHLLRTNDIFFIDTPQRQAAFIAQLGHESGGFSTISESFNYSVDGLLATFPRSRITADQCKAYGRKHGEKSVPLDRQQRIANLVYGGRYGNDNPGDGYLYRGRGLKQVTFHDNYELCGHALGVDLVSNPDLLLQDKYAALSAGWFWSYRGLSMYADNGDFVGMTKVINGGTNGLKDRQARWAKAKLVLLG